MNLTIISKHLKTPITLLGVLALSSGLSCAVAPSGGGDSTPTTTTSRSASAGGSVQAAYAQYSRRDFAGAASAYDAVTGNANASASDKRLAHLGKALVYLSTDAEWRDLDEAGKSLQMAESIDMGSSSVETGMLMNAMSSLIGVESNISELDVKLANSTRENVRLKDERQELIAEQANLNEALEKLKTLTIGN